MIVVYSTPGTAATKMATSNINQQLYNEASLGNLPQVIELVEGGADVNWRYPILVM
jgi:hypothetical protein